jgi:hypothetical protein
LKNILALLALVSLPAHADVVQGILMQTYGSGGGNTGFFAPSVLMGTLQSTPGMWSNQTIDCSLNTCLNIPGSVISGTVGSATTAAVLAATPTQCSGQVATGIAANGNANCTSLPAAFSVGTPNTRSLSLATAYQASNTAKGASVNVNLTSTATLSLSGGTTNAAVVYIGSTSAVASGSGTPICRYSNSNTGTLTLGLNLSTIAAVPCHFDLPTGWYFAVLQTSGTVTITDAYDEAIG